MRTLLTLGAAALSVMVAFTGCKKDKDKEPSKTELLTGHTWKLTASTIEPGYNTGTTVITNWYLTQLTNCQKDNLYFFAGDGKYREEEGGSKCADSDPQIRATGTWAFSSDQKNLNITYANGNAENFELQELSKTTLKGTFPTTLSGPTGNANVVFTNTYTAQ